MNRPEPKPMPRPVRVICMIVAFALVCSLGAVIVHRQTQTGTTTTANKTDTSTTSKDSTPTTNATDKQQWAGLVAAGIPVPGDWSRQQTAFRVTTTQDGTRTIDPNGGTSLRDPYGPIDAALTTVNALLDPNGSDDQWRERVFATLGEDGGGVSRSISDAPRWWWTQRRFDKNSTCTGQSADNYTTNGYACNKDGQSTETDTQIIRSNAYYDTSETNFPVPNGLNLSSTVNPQNVVSRAYDTILIPMDDGNWHVTVYCPASLDVGLIDRQANELDPDTVKPGDEAYTVTAATGFGTVQHPCHSVEVTVGGQKPFWSLRSLQ